MKYSGIGKQLQRSGRLSRRTERISVPIPALLDSGQSVLDMADDGILVSPQPVQQFDLTIVTVLLGAHIERPVCRFHH